jgi:hypothetical protein
MKDKNKGQDFSYEYQNGWKEKQIVIRGLISDFKKQMKLRSEAISLFDVQRWTFDVRCSVCSMLDIHLFKGRR